MNIGLMRLQKLVICAVAGTISACTFLQPQPDQSRFFVLTPTAPAAERPTANALRIGLGPIEFPAYLQRPQMVTRLGANEITLSEVHRWGEALEANFVRVLSQNLSEILVTNQIVSYPWYSTQELDYAVRLDVSQFDVDTKGEARLLARWRIVGPTTNKILRTGFADLTNTSRIAHPMPPRQRSQVGRGSRTGDCG
jgi:uncharacterized lipoprotein YmbA